MRKKFVKVMFFGALALATSTSFVGCKDYDDDINRLEQKIEENTAAIEKINKLIASGSVITKVENVTGGVKVTLSNGESFTITNGNDGKDGTTWTIGEDGFWYLNGTKTDKKAIGQDGTNGTPGTPGTPGAPGAPGVDGDTYIPGADGFWYLNEEIPANKTTLQWLPEGTITAVCDGNFVTFRNIAGYPNGVKISLNSTFVASLSYIPTNIDTQLGETAFFPVIGTDIDSEAAARYEYNLSNQAYATTIINGWCDFAFKVNPANVNRTNFEAVTMIADSAYTAARFANAGTRAESKTNFPTLKESSKKGFGYVNNVMSVKASAQGYRMVNTGNVFDDPNGIDASPEFAGTIGGNQMTFVNTVALQVKNVNANDAAANDGIVTSKYVNAKRMVVPQHYVEIGLNTSRDRQESLTLTNFRDLSDMYAKSSSAAQIQAHLTSLPVELLVPFAETTHLSTLIEGYATKFATNTGFDAATSQYLLTRLGFDAPTYKYSVEPYELAQVNQTTRYLQLATNGDISFDQSNTAAIEREPVIKVQMYIGETLVMSKLLKIKVMKDLQVEEKFAVDDIKNIVLGCSTNSQSIDFDQIFNHCGFSKAQFVEAYSNNGTNTYTIFKANAAGEYVPYLGGGIFVVGAGLGNSIIGTALTNNNTVSVETQPQVTPGNYRIQMTFTANATSVKYSPLIVTDDFKVSQPTITANINTTYWSNGNAQFNVQAPKTGFNATECIFDADLNIYFLTGANGKAIQTYTPAQPTTGDYSCATTDFIFDNSTVEDANGVVSFVTGTAKQIRIGTDVIATIDVTRDHIVLTNSPSTQDLLNTGKFTIKDVKLQVTLPNGVIEVKKFNIDVVRPLTLSDKATGSFTDAQNLGDNLGFDQIIAMKDWRNKAVTVPGNANDAERLGTFYDVLPWAINHPFYVKTGTDVLDNIRIKTNLKKDANGDWTPDASVTEATATVTLPAGTDLTVVMNAGKYYLNYKTNMGTVTKAYKMWIPVAVGYKWGKVMGSVEVTVNPVN